MTDLHQSKLLLAGVVVSGGSLVLLSVIRTLFVGVLICWMNQFPGILRENVKDLLAKPVTNILKEKSSASCDNHDNHHFLCEMCLLTTSMT